MVTSTDLPSATDPDVASALSSVTDLQRSMALSYGGGVRYELTSRLDLRVDIRQYLVFSVSGVAASQLSQQLEQQTGQNIPQSDDSTVQYNELTAGIAFKF